MNLRGFNTTMKSLNPPKEEKVAAGKPTGEIQKFRGAAPETGNDVDFTDRE